MSAAALDSPEEIRVAHIPGSRWSRMRRWMADPLAFLTETHEHGDVVVADLGVMQMWQLYRPEHIERVLVRNARNYTKDTRGYRAMRIALGNGLVTSQGDLWKRQRRIANPAFHRKTIATMGDAMVDCAQDMAAEWESSTRAGEMRDVSHDMMQVTLKIAARTFFSLDVNDSRADRIGDATAAVVKQFLMHMSFPLPNPEYLPTLGNLRYWRAVRTLNREVSRIISDRRASAEQPHDLLSLFLNAVDDETGEQMSDQQLRDEMVTMVAAGHETTASALSWALHLLAQNPDVQTRLRTELREVLGDRAPTGADLKDLPFLGRVLQESMRLYPPAWVHARQAAEDDTFDGLTIPAGSIAILPQWAVHRDPTLWEDPLRFDPDRFLPERSEGRPKFAYFPFSGGQRKCIGDRFAIMEASLVLAVLLSRFEIRPVASKPVVPEPAVTLRARDGIWQTIASV